MEKNVDYIIVGQGIAGTVLAYQLLKAGKKVMVVDYHNPNSSSNVATGLINPVTGRKMVKSWMVDELLPFAATLYKSLEEALDIKFYHPKPIYKIFTSVGEQNEWILKSDEKDYREYLSPIEHPNWATVETPYGVGIVKQCAWVDIKSLVAAFRSLLKEQDMLVETKMDYADLAVTDEMVEYKSIKANRIIFCEGFNGRHNPYLDYLPFSFAKGEVMKVKSEGIDKIDGILNKGGQIIPLGENLYNVGSTFKWDDEEETISEQGLIELKKKFEKISSADYEVISQVTGIRPTVKDRRPFLGASSSADNVFVFNGMGTKGISLSPYFAKHLIEHMEEGKELIREVNIRRFD